MNQRINEQGFGPQLYISQKIARLSASLPTWRRELKALVSLYRLWVERARYRRQLAQLEDHILKDIGISRFDALSETRKPFWKA